MKWGKLTKSERAELMLLQMSPSSRHRSYLPDDCSECGVCGSPMLGAGKCNECNFRFNFLMEKAK